jgi:hypothetical protein
MKSLEQIKRLAKKADYERVAELVEMSSSTVRMVVNKERTDHHNIQKTFSDYLEFREKLAAREAKKRERQRERELAKG